MKEKKRQKINPKDLIRCIILVAIACVVYGVMQGVHDNYGIMLKGLIGTSGLTYSGISFCIGIGAFIYGLAQPFLGMLALKKSNSFVIVLGIICMIIGLIGSPLSRNFPLMLLFFGILLPFGTAGLSFGIVMGAITPMIGEKRAIAVSGIVQASAGVGDALMSPSLQLMSSSIGIRWTMFLLTIPFLIMIPIAIWLSTSKQQQSEKDEEETNETLLHMIGPAFKSRDYKLVLIGFATCGFNMSIIESHLFSQYTSYGINPTTASLTLTIYGIATMLGAVLTGFLGTKLRMKNVLAGTYFVRVIVSLGFLFLPKSVAFAFIATTLLGISGDSTVPPTTGIITKEFGSKKMAVLYGFALIGHQVGAFLSAYLGGVFVDMGFGYEPLWTINLLLALLASVASFCIKQK